jgi:hypothetical protein
MLQKCLGPGLEGGVAIVPILDHLPQGFQDGWQVGLELGHRLTEFSDFGALISEKQLQQLLKLFRVIGMEGLYYRNQA